MPTPKSAGYAPVNGLKIYYEIYGEGKPLLLLHGSYMNIGMNYAKLIPELSKTHQVIAFEMQGHGRTADIDRKFSYPALADDAAGLLKYLKIDSADVLGYSLGAVVALKMTLRHPEMVSKLVFISGTYKTSGWTPEARKGFLDMKADFLTNTPLKTEYDLLAPDKSHWLAFVKKMIEFDNEEYDFGAENIRKIKVPVLLINGDNDGVDKHHVADLYDLVGGSVFFADMVSLPPSRLAIIPGATHVTLMMATAKLAEIITPFLQ
ncbi:alpha/beta fold hydrolase [Chitinophaga vietnamensis]|uniref:alpha/beta fold hydrolase n=1 Tax=Chitinophaga vietnamensis TaxID=2593957 RepID=UPI0011782AE4|nr:alpha/beta hydrolase [Chitinophaga vietnamensis]